MRVRIFSASLFVLSVCGLAIAQGAETGSIQGEIKARGVRSPKDVLVYVENIPGEHKPPTEPVQIDQKDLVFVPRVLPIVKGTTVEFHNNDSLLHNVFWLKSKDRSYSGKNLGSWGKGGTKKFTYKKEGSVVLLCNIHPEMEAFVKVLQNPAFAVVGKDGLYEIKDVPAGQYTVKTWYPQSRKLRSKSAKVTVKAGESTTLNFSLSR